VFTEGETQDDLPQVVPVPSTLPASAVFANNPGLSTSVRRSQSLDDFMKASGLDTIAIEEELGTGEANERFSRMWNDVEIVDHQGTATAVACSERPVPDDEPEVVAAVADNYPDLLYDIYHGHRQAAIPVEQPVHVSEEVTPSLPKGTAAMVVRVGPNGKAVRLLASDASMLDKLKSFLAKPLFHDATHETFYRKTPIYGATGIKWPVLRGYILLFWQEHPAHQQCNSLMGRESNVHFLMRSLRDAVLEALKEAIQQSGEEPEEIQASLGFAKALELLDEAAWTQWTLICLKLSKIPKEWYTAADPKDCLKEFFSYDKKFTDQFLPPRIDPEILEAIENEDWNSDILKTMWKHSPKGKGRPISVSTAEIHRMTTKGAPFLLLWEGPALVTSKDKVIAKQEAVTAFHLTPEAPNDDGRDQQCYTEGFMLWAGQANMCLRAKNAVQCQPEDDRFKAAYRQFRVHRNASVLNMPLYEFFDKRGRRNSTSSSSSSASSEAMPSAAPR
jgi:hypothetical protein